MKTKIFQTIVGAVASALAVMSAQAGDLVTIAATRPLQDYCTLTGLPPGSCGVSVNYGIRETCPKGTRAVAVSCFISDLSYPLAINATMGQSAICDWRTGPFIGTPIEARIEVLCGNVPLIERKP